ncbi:unnamed protein product [Prorocentrum cordatum]|uniref:Uncharacterized protein n=1 Tax=Prorocentrum cordatum TaxID=2364126 RepID=A0ABN9RCP9_9DINO|nr:unnamed protein product [Polarella glacialis]
MVVCYRRPGEIPSPAPQSFLPPAPRSVGTWVLLAFPEEGGLRRQAGERRQHPPGLPEIRLRVLSRWRGSGRFLDWACRECVGVFRRACLGPGWAVAPRQGPRAAPSASETAGR